ncbi:MAG TPA: glutathione S-transferase family protein [Dongiaceae bacterium]|jgi:glutathione S-transferase|nr:glutathione S-transferase family protein [Dongiaceae bacterium]
MAELILTTFDWVPEPPRGYVRDLRVRWALEEAGLPYRVASTPFKDRSADHFAHQPFGQVPWLTDGDTSIFESGAILLHIAEQSKALMPTEAKGRAEVITWLFAALNSVETAVLPYMIFKFYGDDQQTSGRKAMDDFLTARLGHMEKVLSDRPWLTGAFSIADILMSDVLRLVNHFGGLAGYPACLTYVERATARPAFKKAHADQIKHFAAAD